MLRFDESNIFQEQFLLFQCITCGKIYENASIRAGFFWTHLLPYLVASLLLLTGVGTPRRQSLKYLMVKNTLDEFLLATYKDR